MSYHYLPQFAVLHRYVMQQPSAINSPLVNPSDLIIFALTAAFGVIAFLGKHTLDRLERDQSKLRDNDQAIAAELARLRQDLAEQFVTRDMYLQGIMSVSTKLDRVGEHVAEVATELRIRRAVENEPN